MQVEERVKKLVEEKIADNKNLFLVDVRMLPNNKLIIEVDGDDGISIQECAEISRHVGFHLEEEDAIEVSYNLEVSSPGVGEPLKLARQFVKNIGRNLAIKQKDGLKKEGKLLEVKPTSLIIEEIVKQKGKKASIENTEIERSEITETTVLVSFK